MPDPETLNPSEACIDHQRQAAFELMFGEEGSITKLLQEAHKPGLSLRAEEKPIIERTMEEADRVLTSSANTVFYWVDVEDEKSTAIIEAAKFIISKWCRTELKLKGESKIADSVGSVAIELACQLQVALGSEEIKQGVYPKHRRSLVEHYGPDFTRDFLEGTMIEEVLEITSGQAAEVMTQGTKNKLAANYPRNILQATTKVKENFDALDTDKVAQVLEWRAEEVEELLTIGLRRQLAQDPQTNPFKVLQKIKSNIELLTTDNITQATGWSETEVEAVFTTGFKRKLAIRKRRDPLAAAGTIAANLDVHLSDKNIAETLGWDEEEVARIFTPGLKRTLAKGHMDNPIEASKKIKDNLELLTDQTIAKTIGWTEAQVQQMFTAHTKKVIAVGHMRDPLGKVRRIKRNFNEWRQQYSDLPEKLLFTIAVTSSKKGPTMLKWLDETRQSLPPSQYAPRALVIWKLYKHMNKNDPVAEAMRSAREHVLMLQIHHPRSTDDSFDDYLLKITADTSSPDPLSQIIDEEEQGQNRSILERLANSAGIDTVVVGEMLEMEDPLSHPAFKKIQEAALNNTDE